MGIFGTAEPFVPLKEATLDGDDIRLPIPKDKVKQAPRVDADQHLDVEQERELYRYYGLDYDQTAGMAGGQRVRVWGIPIGTSQRAVPMRR